MTKLLFDNSLRNSVGLFPLIPRPFLHGRRFTRFSFRTNSQKYKHLAGNYSPLTTKKCSDSLTMVRWNDFVDVIPNVSSYADAAEWSDDNYSEYSDTSQSMEELNGDETFGEDNVFGSLDENALDEISLEDVSDKSGMEYMPKEGVDSDLPGLDSDVGSMSSDGKAGYGAAAAGLLSGGVFVRAQAFVMDKISSLRSMSAGNDDEGVDVVSDAVDVDDLQNAAKSLGNNAYTAASESSRNGFGVANLASSTPTGVESAA
jgi:hypothetical protein